VSASRHGVLQDLKRVCLEAEYPLLRVALLAAEKPDHHRALVQRCEDLRDVRALA